MDRPKRAAVVPATILTAECCSLSEAMSRPVVEAQPGLAGPGQDFSGLAKAHERTEACGPHQLASICIRQCGCRGVPPQGTGWLARTLSQESGVLKPCHSTHRDSGQALPCLLSLEMLPKGRTTSRALPATGFYNSQAWSPQLFLLSIPFLVPQVSLTQKWARDSGRPPLPASMWVPAGRGAECRKEPLAGVGLRVPGQQQAGRGAGVGAGPSCWALSVSSSDIYRGKAVYTLPVPALHLSPHMSQH